MLRYWKSPYHFYFLISFSIMYVLGSSLGHEMSYCPKMAAVSRRARWRSDTSWNMLKNTPWSSNCRGFTFRMNRHQVLTGAANSGDHCFAVGSVEGVHFTVSQAPPPFTLVQSSDEPVRVSRLHQYFWFCADLDKDRIYGYILSISQWLKLPCWYCAYLSPLEILWVHVCADLLLFSDISIWQWVTSNLRNRKASDISVIP